MGMGAWSMRGSWLSGLLLLGFSALSPSWAQVTAGEVVSLPTASAWGGGDVVGSQLIGRTYNAGGGPGIWVVADGGYRLYYNGELLAQDNQAGRVTFVPMTFLPGTNVIAVAGFDSDGAPGVLVQIDELEKTYVSDASWKVSSSVTDNTWKSKTYNDASWSQVTASGPSAKMPSGAALNGFASGSGAKWIWTSAATNKQAVLRYTFQIKAEGFGAATTGGEGGSVVIAKDSTAIANALASSTAQIILVPEGTYDLRRFRNAVTEATAAGRTWCKSACGASDLNKNNTFYRIAFEANNCSSLGTGLTIVKESENLQSWSRWITTKPNKTLMGMGRGANLRGASIYMRSYEGSYNNIYRNLAIYDVNPHLVEAGDGLSIVGSNTNRTKQFWADHISYKWISDGLDLEYATETTISWLDYDGRNEYNCWQTDPYVSLVEDMDVTYANVYWHATYGRVPKVGSGTSPSRVHIYNSVVDTNSYFMIGAEGASSTANTQVLFENNYVDHATYAYMLKGNNGFVKWTGNNTGTSTAKFYTNNVASTTAPNDAVFTPPYSYTKRTVVNLPAENKANAGVGGRWGNMPSYNQAFGLANQAPTVTLSVANTGALQSPATLSLTATASDADGSIVKVDFYVGNTLVGSDNSAPYSFAVTSVPAGTFSLVAKAYDDKGLEATSAFVTVTAVNDSVPEDPTILGPLAPGMAHAEGRFEVFDMQGRPAWSGTAWPPRIASGIWIVVRKDTHGHSLSRMVYQAP